MNISEVYRKKRAVSLEIFPPKGELKIETAFEMLEALHTLSPDFISVTCSAGGTGDSNNTIPLAGAIKNNYSIEAMAHVTCINSRMSHINDIIDKLKETGIENVMALRGDKTEFSQESDFKYASQLIPILRENGFGVGAGCYPEGHVACESLEADIRHLREKQEAGAQFFISQLFFDNERYFEFLDRAQKAGITVPISAGVMPILSKAQVSRMIFMCGASLPSAIIRLLNKYEDSPEQLREAGIEHAAQQISQLIENGVDGVHIYTMNQSEIASKLIKSIKERR